jgi:hypothetical protein
MIALAPAWRKIGCFFEGMRKSAQRVIPGLEGCFGNLFPVFEPPKRLPYPQRAQISLEGHAVLFLEPIANATGIQAPFPQISIPEFNERRVIDFIQ